MNRKISKEKEQEARERLCRRCQFNKGTKRGVAPLADCHHGLIPLTREQEDCPYFEEMKNGTQQK